MADLLHLWSFYLFCLTTLLSDLLFRRVLNVALAIGIALQLGFVLLSDGTQAYPATTLQVAAVGLAAGLVVFLPFYALKAMGAGDVKFYAALGFWLGPSALLPVWLLGSVLAGLDAVARAGLTSTAGLWWRMRLGDFFSRFDRAGVWKRSGSAIVARRAGRSGIPYAAYLAIVAIGFTAWQTR